MVDSFAGSRRRQYDCSHSPPWWGFMSLYVTRQWTHFVQGLHTHPA